MADTLTIRLDPEQRRLFDAEALARGVGPSTLARELLSERLREIRRAQIYRESEEAGRRYQAAVAAGTTSRPTISIRSSRKGWLRTIVPSAALVGEGRANSLDGLARRRVS